LDSCPGSGETDSDSDGNKRHAVAHDKHENIMAVSTESDANTDLARSLTRLHGGRGFVRAWKTAAVGG
jgi:hypothetical protein